MQFFTRILTIILITLCGTICVAQKIVRIEKSPIVCYANAEDSPTRIERPQLVNARNAGIPATANIEVVYNGFSPQAQAAFQYAVDIWANLITSPITIRVSANWTVLGTGVLGSAGPTFFASDFEGAPRIGVAYPGALAEKLAGKDINDPTEFDISANFNSDFNWYYNTTGQPASGQYDLISVILHELGHGLGFVDTYNYTTGVGEYGSFTDGVPFSYDVNVENLGNVNLYQSLSSPSTSLGTQLVSNNLYYRSPLAVSNNGGVRPKIYAPSTWSGGSSIAHLDETTYPSGNINSLMSPQFAAREVNHNPGPITLNLFKDMGWTTVYIDHEPIESTENASAPAFDVVATITADNTPGYALEASQIFLNYYTSANATVVSLPMATTGSPNEYLATLPAPGGNELDYFYYISVGDNLSRTITNPGKVYTPLQAPVQGYYSFHAGPDTDAPVINHTPVDYISFLETEITINAAIVDRYELNFVNLEYELAGVPQTPVQMTFIDSNENPLTGMFTSNYEITIPISSLTDGEELTYKIIAEDNSPNTNVGVSPASDFHTIIFKGIKTAQEGYLNDFNSASDDFLGASDEFSITQPAGFNNPAIHSIHPYPEAGAGNALNFTYTLRVPIEVKGTEAEATIKFDEIVLVEPGEPNSVFPDEDFYDYVVVEASSDAGETWTPLADGYDSRDFAPWLTKYNSANATGDPSLFRTRQLNLLDEFNEGDEIIVRFRLFSDPGAAGWGWAIDNVKIQIDDEFPTLLHQHYDLVKAGTTSLLISSETSDNISVDKVLLEYGINNNSVETLEVIVDATSATVEFPAIDLSSLSEGDKIVYKLTTLDQGGNQTTIPTEGYFEVPVVDLHTHVDQYANNFNSETNDFVGNFFSITQPSGFSDGAIHSSHNYLIGFGEEQVSDFTYTLKKSIVLSSDNSRIRFDEIVIVEDHAAGAVFGTPGFNDYVIVEGSKDDGNTWLPFIDGYDAKDQSDWQTAFNTGAVGTSALFHRRLIDMTENGNFATDDHVNIRFRLFSDHVNNGWGWAIDNLYIQDAVTGAEKEIESAVTVYPNPVKENITVEAIGLTNRYFDIQLINAQGLNIYTATEGVVEGKFSHSISSLNLPAGVYIVKVGDGINTIIKRVIKLN